MSSQKKQIRAAFRTAVFERDRYQCVMCGRPGKDRQGGDGHKKYHKGVPDDKLVLLDAHHITDRNLLPNGGYVKENGVTVCGDEEGEGCHALCEVYHRTGTAHPGHAPEDLYAKIKSSLESARQASLKLG